MPRLVLEVLRWENLVAMQVVEMDEGLRGAGAIGTVDGCNVSLHSEFFPVLADRKILVCGDDRSKDGHIATLCLNSPEKAAAYISKIKRLVRHVNENTGASEPSPSGPVVERVE